jgi:hypothetical protein
MCLVQKYSRASELETYTRTETMYEQVLTVLMHMTREDAVALLQSNHNSAEDAIMSALM